MNIRISFGIRHSCFVIAYHGNLLPPLNGLVGGELGGDADEVSSAVTTLSPSLKPSVTSVTIPSLIPVFIWTGFGLPNDKT